MKRRAFIAGLSSAAAWPLATQGQQRELPVVGYLTMRAATDTDTSRDAALMRGLAEAGCVNGRDFRMDVVLADNLDQIPALATEIVRRKVAVIFGSAPVAIAAKKATNTIPIVFVTPADPVIQGLVPSLNRPGGNVTGVRMRAGAEPTKMLELMHEIVPSAGTIGVLINPSFSTAESEAKIVADAGRSIGVNVIVVGAKVESEFEAAFARLAQAHASAVLVLDVRYFDTRRDQIVALAMRYRMAAASQPSEFAVTGGLFSYGASINEAIRQGAVYVCRIIKGEKPADLPIVQPSKFNLVINLKTAKALGLTVPAPLLLRADEVIE